MFNYSYQKGQIALLLTIVILAAMLSIGAGLTMVTLREIKMAKNIEESAIALQAADAGTEYALYKTEDNPPALNEDLDRLCSVGWTTLPNGSQYCLEYTGSNAADPESIKSTGKFAKVKRAIIVENSGVLLYGGSSSDLFYSVYSDGTYIYAVGYTWSEGSGGEALIVKFNSDLSIAARKVYGGGSDDLFYSVYSDGTYIYAVGRTFSEGSGSADALIVKFNSDLSIAARKVYGRVNWDEFFSVYSDGTYIYAVGHTASEGSGGEALIVKFNSDLSIAARKVYGGVNWDEFFSVYSDGTYIYAVGWTYSEGCGGLGNGNALIVKFNSNLSIAARKVYGGNNEDRFYSVYSDGTYIYAVGRTYSEGSGSADALIVKFNSDLSIAARKVYGGGSGDYFYSVYSDGTYIYAVGYTRSEGSGDEALIVKFNSDLSIAARKVYGGGSRDHFYSVYSDGTYIYAVGETWSEGSGSTDALIVKFPKSLSMKSCLSLIPQDSNLTLANSGLTLQNSGLTLANSGLTLQNSNLILQNSGLGLGGCPPFLFKEVKP